MLSGGDRALQLRVVSAIRGRLRPDPRTGLILLRELSSEDQATLLDAGGHRLGAVAITLDTAAMHAADRAPSDPIGDSLGGACDGGLGVVRDSGLEAVGVLIAGQVRRSDLLVRLDARWLVLLAPGLDPFGGRAVMQRLGQVLLDQGQAGGLGAAYRSPLSPLGWSLLELAREAADRAAAAAQQRTPAAAA